MKYLIFLFLLFGCSTTVLTYHQYRCQVSGWDDSGYAKFSQCEPVEYPQSAHECVYFGATKDTDKFPYEPSEFWCTGKTSTVTKE